jgi:hypothetical protein
MRDKFLFMEKKREEMIKGKNIALYITWLRVSSMMIIHGAFWNLDFTNPGKTALLHQSGKRCILEEAMPCGTVANIGVYSLVNV